MIVDIVYKLCVIILLMLTIVLSFDFIDVDLVLVDLIVCLALKKIYTQKIDKFCQ